MRKLSSEISLKINFMHNFSRDNIMFNLQRLHYSCAQNSNLREWLKQALLFKKPEIMTLDSSWGELKGRKLNFSVSFK